MNNDNKSSIIGVITVDGGFAIIMPYLAGQSGIPHIHFDR
jgi:hypothetical protein